MSRSRNRCRWVPRSCARWSTGSAGLSSETRTALLFAAASGGERVQPVIAAIAAANLESRILEAAERAGVVSIDGERFEFRHPLLRSAIYQDADAPARREAHAALAAVTDDAPRAWHLAHATAGENEAVAAALERVALDARLRGAPSSAAAAHERAAALTPSGGEQVRRLTEAARDAHLAGRPAAAMRLLDAALARTSAPLPVRGHPAHPRPDPGPPRSPRRRLPGPRRRRGGHPARRSRPRRGDARRRLPALAVRRRCAPCVERRAARLGPRRRRRARRSRPSPARCWRAR